MRELGKISSGVLGHLDETRLLLARLALYFSRFTPPGPRNPNHCGTRPTLLNSVFIRLLIYRIRLYLVFTLHHLSYCAFIACQCTRTVHTVIALYDCCFSPFTCTFFYCVYNSYTHFRSFAALHHLNSAGILHISAHVAWIVDISMDILLISSGFMDLLHITRMVNQGLQVSMMLIIAC